ncbi:MAG: hypothetical protein ACHQZS_04545 [Candidatus Binatales bacterium]
MPVRGKTVTAMLLESIDDRPNPSAAAKDDSDNFAAELGAAIVTGETDFGTLPPSRPAFKDTPASSPNHRTARAGSAKTSEKTPAKSTLAPAPLAPAFVPVAPNNSTPDLSQHLSQTDADLSVANATAKADLQNSPSVAAGESAAADWNQTAGGKSAPDYSATSQAPTDQVATDSTQSAQSWKSPSKAHITASTSANPAPEQQPAQDQQPSHSPADSTSGVSLKIKSASPSNSTQQAVTAQPNDTPVRQTSQASAQTVDQAVAQAIKPALQKDQPGQPQPDAAAGTNLASVTGAHNGPTQSQAGDTRAVTVTPVASVTPIAHAPETAIQRVANLKVDLNDAGTAHATIRERAGEVDVKIVTPDSDSARNLANEVNALRHSLDNAGLKLRNAEVVYRSDRYQNPQRDDSRQNSQQSGAGSAETFTIEEINQ